MRLTSLALCLMLGACATTPVAVPVVQPRADISVPSVAPMTLQPLHWHLVGSSYTLDAENYRALVLNLAEITRYVTQQNAVVKMLKSLIEPVNSAGPR